MLVRGQSKKSVAFWCGTCSMGTNVQRQDIGETTEKWSQIRVKGSGSSNRFPIKCQGAVILTTFRSSGIWVNCSQPWDIRRTLGDVGRSESTAEGWVPVKITEGQCQSLRSVDIGPRAELRPAKYPAGD